MPRRLAGARRSQKKRDTDSLVDRVAEGTIFDSVMADNYWTPVKVRAICFPLDTASLKNALKDSMLIARLNNDRSTTFRKEVHCTSLCVSQRPNTMRYREGGYRSRLDPRYRPPENKAIFAN